MKMQQEIILRAEKQVEELDAKLERLEELTLLK
jgi:hypothetical protein